MLYALRVIATMFAALVLVPAGVHLASMVSKLRLSEADYLVSQRAYDGWNLFAIAFIGALASALALTVALWRAGAPYRLAGLAFLCLAGAQAIFWTVTFPANVATANWTMLPDGWEALRARWEYSHAAGAALDFAALLLLVLASTKSRSV